MTLDVVSGARVLCICNGHPDSKPGSVTPMIGPRSTILEREREKDIEREREPRPDSSAVYKRVAASGSDPKSGIISKDYII